MLRLVYLHLDYNQLFAGVKTLKVVKKCFQTIIQQLEEEKISIVHANLKKIFERKISATKMALQ